MSNSNSNKNYTLYFFLIAIIVGIIWGKGPFKKLQKDELHSNANKPSFNDKNKIDTDSAFLKSYIRSKLLLSSTIKAQDVTIGTQTWTSKNLDVSNYRNGDIIPQVQDKKAWAKLTTGAWCYYENKAANGTKYGKLYNWYAVHDPRGLAPAGWHVPTYQEWDVLSTFLGEYEKKLKSASGWHEGGEGTNSSGFSALPGGNRSGNGTCYSIGSNGYWWLYTLQSGATRFSLSYSSGIGGSVNYTKQDGLSVRCIKD